MFVVGDGEQPAALVIPGERIFVVGGTCPGHGGGERGEGGLGQQALVVAPGAGGGLVMDGDMVARLAVVKPARPGADAQGLTSMASWVRFMVSFSGMAVLLGAGGGPADEGGGALQVRVAADAGADEKLADLAAQARGVGDDGAEIDVVGHAVERAAERDQRAGVLRPPRRSRDRR